MSCSKEMRIPKKWSRYHHDIVKEAVNEEVFTADGCINWMIACGVSDKSLIKKYIESLRPYHFMRCLAATFIPGNASCRDVMTTYMYYVVGTFHVDDHLETYSSSEVHQLGEAYAKLDTFCWEQYPKLPTIPEVKRYLKERVELDEKLLPHLVILVDAVNRITNTLLQHGQFSEDGVRNFRKRLTNALAIALEAVEVESANPSVTSDNTYGEMLWRRIEGGACMTFMPVVEVTAESIGKVKEHVTCITEMYVLSSLFLMFLNDLYSFNKEKIEKTNSDNVVHLMIAKKDALHELDAAEKIVPFMNAIIKVMYQKSEHVKREYPNNPDLHKLLDYIGTATAGWYFIHEKCLPRYTTSTSCHISLVEVEEKELEEWKKDHDQMSFNYEMLGVSIESFLYHSNTRAKTMIDAHCGRISPHGHFIPV